MALPRLSELTGCSLLSKRSLFCTWLGKTRIFYQFSKRLEKVVKHIQRRGFHYNAPAFRIGGHCLVYDDICFGLAPTGLSIPRSCHCDPTAGFLKSPY